MPKAERVLRALTKLGWEEVHCKGSHHKLRRGSDTQMFSYHPGVELGQTQLRIVAKDFGVSEAELKRHI
ncbi:MAG: type II toxin-antitoxin system HicA family toxin [Candidatus Dormibacteria bacterium]